MSNSPHTFYYTRVTRERSNDDIGEPGIITEAPGCRMWRDVRAVEQAADPSWLFNQPVDRAFVALEFYDGTRIFVTDDYDKMQKAWNNYLNGASLVSIKYSAS